MCQQPENSCLQSSLCRAAAWGAISRLAAAAERKLMWQDFREQIRRVCADYNAGGMG